MSEAIRDLLLLAILVETTYLMVMKLKQHNLKVARGSILLDTSSIMDGRIIDVARTGIITAELIIPRSVIREMQLLADKSDHEKRVRARKGLDNIRVLQRLETVSVTVVNDGLVDSGGVDERLLELAQKYDASICTTDYNLNKVAKVINVTVINVNELSQLLRIQYLPGETAEIELTQTGSNRNQAVGYLDDGTMVVVEDAKNLIGKKVKVEISRSLQTEAGRMMFAKLKETKHDDHGSNNSGGSNNTKKDKSDKQKNSVSAASKVVARIKPRATAKKVKSAPSFHTESLTKAKSDDKAKTTKRSSSRSGQSHQSKSATSWQNHSTVKSQEHSTTRPQRKSPQAAEAEMVRLANGK